MKRLLFLVGSCASVAFFALSTAAVAGTIEGTVTLGADKPLVGVEVQFFDATSAELLATSVTGEKGNYSSGNLPEGDYRIRYFGDPTKIAPEFSGSYGKDLFCFATTYFVGAKETLIVDEEMSTGSVTPKPYEYYFSGIVTDAEIATLALEGVVVEFRDSENGLFADTIKRANTTTGVDGKYETLFESTSLAVTLRFVDPSGKYFPEYAELTPRSDDFCSGTVYEHGNKYVVNATLDLVPADQQVQVIIDTIDDLALPNDVQNSLGTPLVRAVDLLTDANHMNDRAVCAQLSAFISRIDIQERQGRISTEDADKLRQSAKLSSVALGC